MRKAYRQPLRSPIWRPDGSRLTATASGGGAAAGNSVWMIDPETGEQKLGVQFPQGFVAIFRAAWTEDGKSIIANRRHLDPVADIHPGCDALACDRSQRHSRECLSL